MLASTVKGDIMLYKTQQEAEEVASREYGEVMRVGSHWLVKDVTMNVQEVADFLGVTVKTARKRRDDGKLPKTVHDNHHWLLKDIMALA